MPFSFNPVGGAQPGIQGQAGQAPGVLGQSQTQEVAAPPVVDSPFLFLRNRGQPMSVMTGIQIVLIVVTLLSIVISLSLLSYSLYLSTTVDGKKDELAQKEASFKNQPFDQMKRLSDRAAALDKLLKAYVSARSPLAFLESVVEKQVYFSDFSITRGAAGYSASFTAVGTNYRVIVQQLAALNLTEYNRVIPKPKLNGISDDKESVKIRVDTPIFVQGVRPEDVKFLPLPVGSSSSTTPSPGTP